MIRPRLKSLRRRGEISCSWPKNCFSYCCSVRVVRVLHERGIPFFGDFFFFILFLVAELLLIHAFTTGNLFWGENYFGICVGKGFGALVKGFKVLIKSSEGRSCFAKLFVLYA